MGFRIYAYGEGNQKEKEKCEGRKWERCENNPDVAPHAHETRHIFLENVVICQTKFSTKTTMKIWEDTVEKASALGILFFLRACLCFHASACAACMRMWTKAVAFRIDKQNPGYQCNGWSGKTNFYIKYCSLGSSSPLLALPHTCRTYKW